MLDPNLLRPTEVDKDVFLPIIFKPENGHDASGLNELLSNTKGIVIIDEMESHLRELIKCQHPAEKLTESRYLQLIDEHLAGKSIQDYGVWVYYPWSNKLIHLLGEEEFIEVRTNRNRYKLTQDEQALLALKKIGVIGLSVGQSIAVTMAIERVCGEIRLADFDTAELSNLNRIRTGVHNLGLKKTVIAAREIAEIDPFIKVKIYNEGIVKSNIDEFFGEANDKLDVLVEVCDGLDIKIESRFKARSLGIPVLMDTNDRGMLDVERFDLEPERPILHGLAEGLNPENIKGLSNEDKIPYILKMVGIDQISTRLKASMMEVEQSINTWPQLASSVTLGGAITTDIARRILLDQHHDSGRYYIDLDELIPDSKAAEVAVSEVDVHADNPYSPLSEGDMEAVVSRYFPEVTAIFETVDSPILLDDVQLQKIVDAVIAAPSAGNNQPWKVWYEKGLLFVFHDKYRSHSWGDYFEMGSHMSLGTALENIHLQALKLGLKDHARELPFEDEPKLIAVIAFSPLEDDTIKLDKRLVLANGMYTRCTNRRNGQRQVLPLGFFDEIQEFFDEMPGFKLWFADEPGQLVTLGNIIASCDRIRLLQEKGHAEFYSEVRWDKEHARRTRDGIELAAVDVTEGEKAGFRVARDWKAVELVSKWDKGHAFKKNSTKSVKSASAMVLITVPEFDHPTLLQAGRLVQRVWIAINNRGVSIHPMLSPAFFFNRLIHGQGLEIPTATQQELIALREEMKSVFPLGENDKEVFLMKLSIAENMEARSLRLPKSTIFYGPHA
jgi:hypothetical protein